MLGFLFGFNARLGRLHFLLSTIVVTIMMVAVYIAAITYAFQTTPKGTIPSPTSGPIFAAAILYAWLTLTLQSMRIRDIGWDPVCVIPAWIAVAMVDGVVATKIPAMSLGHEHGTIVGALVNLSLILPCCFVQAASMIVRRGHPTSCFGSLMCRCPARSRPLRPRHQFQGLPPADSAAAGFRALWVQMRYSAPSMT